MSQFICNSTGNKTFLKLLFAFALVLFNTGIFAQTNTKADDLLIEAKKQYSTKDYPGTIKVCNQILTIEPDFKDAHLLLADVYEKLDSVNLEIIHLNKAGEIGREWEVVFRLGEAYYKNENYSEALRYYNIYSDYKYIPLKRQYLLACKMASCKFAIHSINNPGELAFVNIGSELNSGNGEYWPVTSPDGSTLNFMRIANDQESDTNEKFYMAIPDSAIWQIAKPLNDSVLFDNEGIQNLSEGSKILFFTACNRPNGMGDCDIYYIKFENGKWSSPANAGANLNTENWDAEPSFSAEKRSLFFTSNRNGGKGKKDIWKAELLGFSDEGLPQWKEPVNVETKINTGGDETSPLIHPNNRELFFVSDGFSGMGGKDLFVAELNDLGNIQDVKNLGYPINTHYNDVGLSLNYICDTTYFTSARQTEKGLEIFAFNFDRGLPASSAAYVQVNVKDIKTKKPVLTAVRLESQPIRSNKFQVQDTDENGETMFCLQLNRNYAFTVAEPGYLFISKFLNQGKINSIEQPEILEIELQPIEIGAEVQLYNIYYETDSFRILPQSEPELQKLVTFLNNNNDLKIEIQGHTDSSGNAENNKILSERRAKSVVDYLVKNGIATGRLKSGGYGDKIPIASNETAEGRMLNRRTTIKILEK